MAAAKLGTLVDVGVGDLELQQIGARRLDEALLLVHRHPRGCRSDDAVLKHHAEEGLRQAAPLERAPTP
jgi:hypothetical protein